MSVRATALEAVCAAVRALSPSLRRALANGLARLMQWLPSRERRVIDANLALIAPTLALDRRAVLAAYAFGTLDTLKIWASEPAALLAQIEAVNNEDLLDQAQASGRGVLIAAPHLGAFELLNLYLAARGRLTILYKPPKQAWLEPFLNRRRERSGANAVAASASAVRALLKALKRGDMVGILPDQQPKLGEGAFAPFFGVDALTMTLYGKLAASAGAVPLLAFAERTPRGYRIVIKALPQTVADSDPTVAVAALNAAIECVVRCAPMQYQWSYKRWSMRPDGQPKVYR
jgi:Kdo2-lipid IVA lauroyltransferase/acyltransferase